MRRIGQLLLYVSKNLMSVKIFIPLILMLVWGYLYVQDYITLAKMMGNSLNVVEPTIYLLSNSSVSALVYVVCFVLAVCDIPFEDGGLPYYAMRIGRRRWHGQIIAFAMVLSLLFVLASVIEGVLLCAQAGYFHLEKWSGTARLIANGGAPALPFLPDIPNILLKYTVGEALMLACMLTFLHYLLISLTLFTFNCAVKKTLGVAVVLGMEIGGFILNLTYPPIARAFPFVNAALTEHSSISEAVTACGWFILFILLLSVVSGYFIKKYKFEFLGEK